ncbi:uncharacterized protein LOC122162458 isoform X2 [Centrocercus urophasianus]|uniref:uncharacterized protein LOC122162458 isoform X2 n=1 Tax=Centrocercus urophasianus TaxID=9002 RepID=UPI001C64D565|nr:uncharacterized protein LOC122162458 isoform X2 [Centrocercus urophasianus]
MTRSIFRGLLDTRISLLLQEVSDSWTAAGEDSEEVSQHAYPDPAHRSVLEDSGMDLWSHLVQFCSHNRTADGEDKCIFLYENTQMQTCWSTTTGAVYVCVELPFRYWKTTLRSPWSLLFPMMNNHSTLSLSLQGQSFPLVFFCCCLSISTRRLMAIYLEKMLPENVGSADWEQRVHPGLQGRDFSIQGPPDCSQSSSEKFIVTLKAVGMES